MLLLFRIISSGTAFAPLFFKQQVKLLKGPYFRKVVTYVPEWEGMGGWGGGEGVATFRLASSRQILSQLSESHYFETFTGLHFFFKSIS